MMNCPTCDNPGAPSPRVGKLRCRQCNHEFELFEVVKTYAVGELSYTETTRYRFGEAEPMQGPVTLLAHGEPIAYLGGPEAERLQPETSGADLSEQRSSKEELSEAMKAARTVRQRLKGEGGK